jgi:hypothetical protein
MQTQSAPMGTLSDRGASLIGLLLTVAIVAGLAAGIPLLVGVGKAQSVSTLSKDGPRGVAPAISASSKGGAGSDLAAAAAVACMTNYEAAESAVAAYEAQDGQPPKSIEQVQALVKDPLSSSMFRITIDPNKPGQLQVATPGYAASDGNGNCRNVGG